MESNNDNYKQSVVESPASSSTNNSSNVGIDSSANGAATQSVGGQWPGAFAVFGVAYVQVKKNPQPAILMASAYVIASVISTLAVNRLTETTLADVSEAGVAFDLFNYMSTVAFTFLPYVVLGLLFLLAAPRYALAIADRKNISIGELMRYDARTYLYVFVASLIASLLIGLSALALIIPIIWTIPWFFLVAYIVTDKGSSPFEALEESKRLAQNHKAKAWGVIGATIVFGIVAGLVGFIPVVGLYISEALSSIVTIISAGAIAILYRWLQRSQQNNLQNSQQTAQSAMQSTVQSTARPDADEVQQPGTTQQ